jgi:hypothetical protein
MNQDFGSAGQENRLWSWLGPGLRSTPITTIRNQDSFRLLAAYWQLKG